MVLIADGDVIDLTSLSTSRLNIRANVSGSNIESVRFGFNGNPNIRTENAAPYAAFGDAGGNYFFYDFTPGLYTLTATPFSGNRATGDMGNPLTISFTVIESPDEVVSFTLIDADTDQDIVPLQDGDVIDLANLFFQ